MIFFFYLHVYLFISYNVTIYHQDDTTTFFIGGLDRAKYPFIEMGTYFSLA